SAQGTVLEQQRAQLFTVNCDVAQRLGDDRRQEDGLPGQEVHLTQEAGRAMPDDLMAGPVQDRDLALDDGDEWVARIADAKQHVADVCTPLLAEPSERRQLRFGQHRTGGRGHCSSLLGGRRRSMVIHPPHVESLDERWIPKEADMTSHNTQPEGFTRSTLLRRAGALGAAGLAAPMLSLS